MSHLPINPDVRADKRSFQLAPTRPTRRSYPFGIFMLLACFLVPLWPERVICDSALSERIASYTIDVRLDSEQKTIDGTEHIRWKNASKDTVRELQFHLYLNAFKNTETLFLEGSRKSRGKDYLKKAEDWGWIEIDSLTIGGGKDLTKDSVVDETVMHVPLPSPVLPEDSLSADIVYHAKLPKLMARCGYLDDFFMIGQWFPNLGVYTDKGW